VRRSGNRLRSGRAVTKHKGRASSQSGNGGGARFWFIVRETNGFLGGHHGGWMTVASREPRPSGLGLWAGMSELQTGGAGAVGSRLGPASSMTKGERESQRVAAPFSGVVAQKTPRLRIRSQLNGVIE
jgi:hypothetical protein